MSTVGVCRRVLCSYCSLEAPVLVTGASIILVAVFVSPMLRNNIKVINLNVSVACFAECSLFSMIIKSGLNILRASF